MPQPHRISLIEGWRILEEENKQRQDYWEDAMNWYVMQQNPR